MTLFSRAGARVLALPVVAALVVAVASAPPASAQPTRLATVAEFPSMSVTRAVEVASQHATQQGVAAYISVVDRKTGRVIAQTPNASVPVQSESVVKLLIAAYYLVLHGGYQHTPAALKSRLAYMLKYSDDATASALFRAAAVPTIAKRYGLQQTSNAPGWVGRWGAAQISASDMTRFLVKAAADPKVGPWLIPILAQTAPRGTDGFNQQFGLAVLPGVHGAKQGWGNDTPVGARLNAIHSVGYTARYFVAILQLAAKPTPVLMSTSTYIARLVHASIMIPPRDGLFVRYDNVTYRIAGGAPIRVTQWAAVGGVQPAANLEAKAWGKLAAMPQDGTFIRSGGVTYRIAGGAPIRVTQWAAVGGVQPVVVIDPAALARAGTGGTFDHLRQYPADGTFVRAGSSTYQITGGVPTRVSSWADVGGVQPTVVIDPAALTHAGDGGAWDHLKPAAQ